MEREQQQSSKGTAVGVGVVCSVIGAIIGAVGYHFWKKEEELQRQCHSYSGYVTIVQLIFLLFLLFLTQKVGIFDSLRFTGSLFRKDVCITASRSAYAYSMVYRG
jgi:hypothetical protein